MNTVNMRIKITDDFMFGYVMHHERVCAKVIECLLPGIRIKKVVFKDIQKTIQGIPGTHSVRLDVYLDDGETVINVEMQTGNKINIPQRSRFYGARIDCDQLQRSQDYTELKPTYVIFICTFDPFGMGQYRYTFENQCNEVEGLKLNDGSYKVFINANGKNGDISPELKELLDYFMTGIGSDNELVREIDEIVDYANQDADWRRDYMTYQQAHLDAVWEGERKGKAEGRAEGRVEGRVEGAISTLVALVKDGLLSIGEACKRAGMPEAEFAALVK